MSARLSLTRPSLPLAICLIAAAIAAVGLGRPAADSTPSASASTIEIAGFQFGSVDVVDAGVTIAVPNLDGVPHTLTATAGRFDTGNIEGGASGSFLVPEESGSYEFFCSIHPSMTGTLTVG